MNPAAWNERQLAAHLRACSLLDGIKDDAFSLIRNNIGNITEYQVRQFVESEFARNGLVSSDGPPIIAAGRNSRAPHYEPVEGRSAVIGENEWILIDIWAKLDQPDGTFSDITWVGFTGSEPTPEHREVFEVVVTARDLVVSRLAEAWKNKETLEGWQLDRIARDHITEKGYGDRFIHTTGHGLDSGESVHAPGVVLNDYSKHDTRQVLPGTGLTVEPGIYLDDFGMRSEITVYLDPETGPRVTSSQQDRIVVC